MNMMQLFAGAVPHPPNVEAAPTSGLSPEQVSTTKVAWLSVLSSQTANGFTIDMNRITAFIYLNATFEKVSQFFVQPSD